MLPLFSVMASLSSPITILYGCPFKSVFVSGFSSVFISALASDSVARFSSANAVNETESSNFPISLENPLKISISGSKPSSSSSSVASESVAKLSS